MADSLDISNVIVISDQASPSTLGPFNTANVALFTHEAYGEDFGSDPYKIYLTASEVAADFGTGSLTSDLANAVFAQAPNILTGNGYLAVIPSKPASVKITFSGAADSGSFTFYVGDDADHATDPIAAAATLEAAQTAIRKIPALAQAEVSGSWADGLVVTTPGIISPAFTIKTNTLKEDATDVTVSFATTGIETMATSLNRMKNKVQYCGICATRILGQEELLGAAAVIQADYKMGYFPGTDPADIEVGGKLDLLRSGGFTKTRGLYYQSSEKGALLFAAAYASRGHSINFNGSNTVITMNLKDLATVPVDNLTQTIFNKAKTAGADVYANIEGLSKTFSFGANEYWDSVFCKIYFLKKLAVDCFNYIGGTSTKIPLTDAGVDGLANVCRKVCEKCNTNGYSAPGEWTIPDTFGDPETFKQNIRENGFYVWHPPVSSMTAAERSQRNVLCQVALKESGAVHSANILVTINK